jgi:chorismate mutase
LAFFADQIEASKLIQFSLMANWRRAGQAPSEPRAGLKTELRPALDQLRSQFIDELLATQQLRQAPDCKINLAKAISSYVDRHSLTALQAIALDRGLASVCGD